MAKKLAISPIAGTKNRVFVKPAPAEEKHPEALSSQIRQRKTTAWRSCRDQ